MKHAHPKQNPVTWVALAAVMLVLTVGCMLGSDAWYRAVSASRATAASELPFGIVATEPVEVDLPDTEHGVQKVEKGLDAGGKAVGWLVTVVSEGQGPTPCTEVISADGKTLGGIRDVSGSVGGRYYNIRVQLPYFTQQFEGRYLPVSEDQVDFASGATGSSKSVVANIQTAADFVNDKLI